MGACFAPKYSYLFMRACEEIFIYSDYNIYWTKSYGGEDISKILSNCGQIHFYLKLSKDVSGDLHT